MPFLPPNQQRQSTEGNSALSTSRGMFTHRGSGQSTAVGRVRPSVRWFTLNLPIQLTFDLVCLRVYGSLTVACRIESQGHRSRVRVNKDGNVVGLTPVLDRGQFVF